MVMNATSNTHADARNYATRTVDHTPYIATCSMPYAVSGMSSIANDHAYNKIRNWCIACTRKCLTEVALR